VSIPTFKVEVGSRMEGSSSLSDYPPPSWCTVGMGLSCVDGEAKGMARVNYECRPGWRSFLRTRCSCTTRGSLVSRGTSEMVQ
jgi:hypothetical protein